MDPNIEKFNKFLEDFNAKFLCCYPLVQLPWKEIPTNLTWDQQKRILESTVESSLNQIEPIKLSYQINFLKRLMAILEEKSPEVHDEVYENFCNLHKASANPFQLIEFAFKHYILPKQDTHFRIRESTSFVAEGTTGLVSWQASLALSDYLLQNPSLASGAKVLELGSGTGLCGFIVSRCCGAQRVLLTDGTLASVNLMRDNFERNFPYAKLQTELTYLIDRQRVDILQLKWGEIETVLSAKTKPDLLLAADVVFDPSAFEDLLHSIDYVFKITKNKVKMLLAATLRNEQTFNEFMELLTGNDYVIEECPVVPPGESCLHWDRTTPVKILQITKSSAAASKKFIKKAK